MSRQRNHETGLRTHKAVFPSTKNPKLFAHTLTGISLPRSTPDWPRSSAPLSVFLFPLTQGKVYNFKYLWLLGYPQSWNSCSRAISTAFRYSNQCWTKFQVSRRVPWPPASHLSPKQSISDRCNFLRSADFWPNLAPNHFRYRLLTLGHSCPKFWHQFSLKTVQKQPQNRAELNTCLKRLSPSSVPAWV